MVTDFFIVYHIKDEKNVDTFKKMLNKILIELTNNSQDYTPLLNPSFIELSSLSKINAISNSKIIIFLLSDNLIADDEIYSSYFNEVLEEDIKKISIILKECLWIDSLLANTKIFPSNKISIVQYEHTPEKYKKILFALLKYVKTIISDNKTPIPIPPKVFSNDYDVMISYASEDRFHAKKLAIFLNKRKVLVFYDEFEESKLWGTPLEIELFEKFNSNSAKFCIIFISSSYADKKYTNLEFRAILEVANSKKNKEYILPIRIDSTKLPGLPSSLLYIPIEKGIEHIGNLVLKKLNF